MYFEKLNKKYVENLSVEEINTILRLFNILDVAVSLVDTTKFKKLNKKSGKLAKNSDGNYLNIMRMGLDFDEKSLDEIVDWSKSIWEIVNKEAIENNNKTRFVKTIVLVEIKCIGDFPAGLLVSNEKFSVSQFYLSEIRNCKEFSPIYENMIKSARSLSGNDFITEVFKTHDENELNTILKSFFGIEVTIVKILNLEFDDDLNSEPTSIVAMDDNGKCLSIKVVVEEVTDDVIKEEAINCHNIFNTINKDNTGETIGVESFILDMGAHSRENENN